MKLRCLLLICPLLLSSPALCETDDAAPPAASESRPIDAPSSSWKVDKAFFGGQTDAAAFLKEKDVYFPPTGSSVTYDEATGVLYVCSASKSLTQIDKLVWLYKNGMEPPREMRKSQQGWQNLEKDFYEPAADVTSFLQSKGVNFPEGAFAHFERGLTVYNTAEEMEKVEKLVEQYLRGKNLPPKINRLVWKVDKGFFAGTRNAESFLKSKGIPFPKGASATYNAEARTLTVRNTQKALKKVDSLIRKYRRKTVGKSE